MTKMPSDPSVSLDTLPPEISTKLQRQAQGEVLVDVASRGRYATDASIYQQFPVAVLIPKSSGIRRMYICRTELHQLCIRGF